MDIPAHLEALLDERLAEAVDLLREAIRVDLRKFATDEIVRRLRERPHFLARTPPPALVHLRNDITEGCEKVLVEAGTKIRDLRVFYGAVPKSEQEEEVGITKILSEIEQVTRKILVTWSIPGDSKSDRADDRSVDPEPEYQLSYRPSSAVLWAWQQVRGVDRARFQLVEADEPPFDHTFDLAFFLPEALGDDPADPPPTIN